jgi:hypothetical protein
MSLFEIENIYVKLSLNKVTEICHLNQYLLSPSFLFTKPYEPAFVTNEYFCPTELTFLVTT